MDLLKNYLTPLLIGFIVQKNMKKLRKNWLTMASLKQQLRNILAEKPKINSEPIKIVRMF